MIYSLSVRFLVASVLPGSLWAGSCLAQSPSFADVDSEVVADSLNPDRLNQLQADVTFLASDEMSGRSAADESIQRAAQYIAGRFEEIGLNTELFEGSPLQPLQIPLGAQPGEKESNRIEFAVGEDSEPLAVSLGDGMNPLAIGLPDAKVEGPLVFAGYGITAPDLDYDDYEGVDATGATVIVLRKEPGMNDPNSRFKGTRNTPHAYFATKVTNAIKHGAAAMIIVNDPTSVLGDLQNERSKISQEQERKKAIKKQLDSLPAEAANSRKSLQKKISAIDKMIESLQEDVKRVGRGVLAVGAAGTRAVKPVSQLSQLDADPDNAPKTEYMKAIPIASVARDTVDELLRKSLGQSLESLEAEIDAATTPQSAVLANAAVSLQVELKPSFATTSNVLATLEGRGDLSGETIVLGAHYDHVGMGGFGSLAPGTIAVHNGADDNASGTSAMLAVAKCLVQRLSNAQSHRRLVFIAFTAEERGLLGSKHYVRYPRFSIESTAAMVNMDMVGRLRDNELTVYGVGSSESFESLVDQANERHQFKLFKVSSGYGPSDHNSFYEVGVPVLFFFTGLHTDYHRPSDDFDKIDFGGMVRITDTVCDVTHQLAVREERPKYAETDRNARIRRQMTAFLGVNLAERDGRVELSGLNPDGPASRGGLRVGDRLEKLGKRSVKTVREVFDVIRSRSPGDQLKVQLIRDGKRLEIDVRLETRP
jgi:hypothetical protein